MSLDNILVIALIFAWFSVSVQFQHRLLFWGIIGALVMRGAMIAAGVELINKFDWVLYVFGAFLIFAGVKMLFSGKETMQPEKNLALRLARKCFVVSPDLDGQKLFTRLRGRRLEAILRANQAWDRGTDGERSEGPPRRPFRAHAAGAGARSSRPTDLIFAVDSVPAVFSVTRNAFIVFTSNIFAIIGLRSMYFMLVGALGYFCYLKIGLSFLLAFVGVKVSWLCTGRSQNRFQVEIPTASR